MSKENILVCSYNQKKKLAHVLRGEESKNTFSLYSKNLELINTYTEGYNPAFILKHPNNKYLYVCYESIYEGHIATFKYDNDTLKLINTVSSNGKSTCYLCFDPELKNIININYWDSSITIHPLDNNILMESVYEIKPFIQNNIYHIGDHLDDRQSTSHHHSCVFHNNDLYVPDLGTDKIDIYLYFKNRLIYDGFYQLKKGSGPRYCLVREDKLYIVNELSSSILILQVEGGMIEDVQEISTIPTWYEGKNTCGNILITKDDYIYVSNRGHNSIAIFEILKNGKLLGKDIIESGGRTPRHFNISKKEDKLYVGNQDTNSVVCFKREKGMLYYEKSIECNSPNFIATF